MLSNKQFTDALSFVRSYKDALDCVEQIAERRAAYTHYENFSRAVVEGIQNNQIKLEAGQIAAGPVISQFPLVKINTFAKGLWSQYGLQSVGNREELNTKLDKAIKELQGKVAK